MQVKAVFTAEPERSYLITGGLGGFGLALAVWLATKGARQIVISSRRYVIQCHKRFACLDVFKTFAGHSCNAFVQLAGACALESKRK